MRKLQWSACGFVKCFRKQAGLPASELACPSAIARLLRLCKGQFAAIFFHSGKADNYSAIGAVVIGLFVFQLFQLPATERGHSCLRS
jgi:hypothetical protein